MGASELNYDQYSYEIDHNPWEVFKRLRDETPVWRNEKYNYWVLNASQDWETSAPHSAPYLST